MNRAKKIAGVSLVVLVLMVAALVLLLATFDWNRARPWLNQKVSEAADRPFAINGDLKLAWHRQEGEETGWRAKIPWPHFSAEQVTMGNPDWARTGRQMGQVGKVEFSINPLALLGRQIAIPTVILTQPDLVLERAADGRNNWTFKQEDKPGKWKLDLGRVQLDSGQVRVVDAIRHADITAKLDSLPQADAEGYQLRWTLQGKLEGETLQGKGRAGQLLALREPSTPYPIEADLKVGSSRLAVHGTVARPRSQAAVDVRLDLSGSSMAKLYPLTTVLLPETSPYMTRGHLKGQMNEDGGTWTYENFTGKVGASDLSGSLTWRGRKPRPQLEGNLVSKLLRFEDLGSLIGSPPNGKNARGQEVKKPAPGKVLPEKSFRTERWKTLDADVQFTGHKIVRNEDLPIENLRTHLVMKDGVLQLAPLNFGVAGGNLVSDIKLDGREGPIKADLKMEVRRLQLKKLFPAVESMHASVGVLNGNIQLAGRGDSVSSLLASSNGEIHALMDKGTISKFVLEAIGLNVGSMVVTKLFGDKQIEINCMASAFAVEKGVMKTRYFNVDTRDAIITMDGQINLAKEQLDLVILPESRNLRVLSLRSPLYVKGTFRKPEIAVDKAVLAAKTGGAVALGVLAPVVTALLPLVNAGGADEDTGCQAWLTKTKKAVAEAGKK
ncbi:MAG: AsmA family protein [Paucimonas sp.]|nr:AsmA family protein [Paucimonas sp.]